MWKWYRSQTWSDVWWPSQVTVPSLASVYSEYFLKKQFDTNIHLQVILWPASWFIAKGFEPVVENRSTTCMQWFSERQNLPLVMCIWKLCPHHLWQWLLKWQSRIESGWKLWDLRSRPTNSVIMLPWLLTRSSTCRTCLCTAMERYSILSPFLRRIFTLMVWPLTWVFTY
jgi:hypothetical protein